MRATRRSYRGETLVLDTEFDTPTGSVRVTDFLPIRDETPHLVASSRAWGSVAMKLELVIRFGYGETVPWVRRLDGMLTAVAGPNGVALRTPVPTRGKGLSTTADFTVVAGERVPFVLSWYPSHVATTPAGRGDAAARPSNSAGGKSGRAVAPTPGPGARRWFGRSSPSRP